jgi:hypothetical protein
MPMECVAFCFNCKRLIVKQSRDSMLSFDDVEKLLLANKAAIKLPSILTMSILAGVKKTYTYGVNSLQCCTDGFE